MQRKIGDKFNLFSILDSGHFHNRLHTYINKE